jgi:hypothetical protein
MKKGENYALKRVFKRVFQAVFQYVKKARNMPEMQYWSGFYRIFGMSQSPSEKVGGSYSHLVYYFKPMRK